MLINIVSWVKKINFLFVNPVTTGLHPWLSGNGVKGKDVKVSNLGNGFSIPAPFPPFKVPLYL